MSQGTTASTFLVRRKQWGSGLNPLTFTEGQSPKQDPDGGLWVWKAAIITERFRFNFLWKVNRGETTSGVKFSFLFFLLIIDECDLYCSRRHFQIQKLTKGWRRKQKQTVLICSMHGNNSVPAIRLGNRLEPKATVRQQHFQTLSLGKLNPKHMQCIVSFWELCQQVKPSPVDTWWILTWKAKGLWIHSCSGEDGFSSKYQY